jgi:hypothetical protein
MEKNYILDKELLEKRLKELAETPYPEGARIGVMCYDPAVLYYSGEYECVICGKVTGKYGNDEIRNIEGARHIVTELKGAGYDVLLDEREYCRYCKNDSEKKPELVFMIRFNQNENYHKAQSNDYYDYDCVQCFLKGNKYYIGKQRMGETLHDHIDRIYRMTGLGADTVAQWARERREKKKAFSKS